jgi:radical SAM superfamily enzyme YgiQ (UPF0313 family)
MKVLTLLPPRYRGLWSSREHKDGYFNEPHNPYFAASILGVVRQRMPDADLEVLDAQLDDLDFAAVRARVDAVRPDAIVCMLNFACLDEDRRYLELPYPTVGVIQAYIDQREAMEMYDLRPTCLTKTEAEHTVAEALAELRDTGKIEKTPGLLIPREGQIADTGDRTLPDLATFPFPAFDLFDIERYMALQHEHSGTRYVFLYTTRGCPFQCTYCAAGTKAYTIVRKKTVDQVLGEMRYFIGRGYRHFYFYDDEFAIDMKRAKALCRRIIDERLDIRFACYNTTNLVDEELIELMSRAGCHLVRYGVETGDMAIQKAMETYVEEAEVLKAFDLTHKYGIFVDTFVLVGLPGETPESLRKTEALLRRVRPDRITTSILFPKPYSKMYKQMKADGRLLVRDWTKHVNAPGLTFEHDTYRDIAEIRAAEAWIRTRMLRYLSWQDLLHNHTKRNLYTRLIHHAGTYDPVRRLIDHVKRRHTGVYRLLRRRYHRYSKFQV